MTLGFVALLLALTTPATTSQLTPLAEYNRGRRLVKQYKFNEARRVADYGIARYCPAEPIPCAYFRLLSGEVDMFRGDPKAALTHMDPLPPQLSRSRLEARRLYLRAYATYFSSGAADAEPLLPPAERLARDVAPEIVDEIALLRAVMLLRTRTALAESETRQVLENARIRKDRFLEATSLGNLGVISMYLGRLTEALAFLHEAQDVFRSVGSNPPKLAANIGYCYQELGDYDTAISNMQEAIPLLERQGAVRDQVVFTTNIGVIAYNRGNYAAAKSALEKAVAIAHRAQLFTEYKIALSDLAAVAAATGSWDAAERYNREAIDRMRKSGDSRGLLVARITTARIIEGKGNDAEAEKIYREVADHAADNKPLLWSAQSQLAAMYVRQGRDTRADREYRNALATGDAARGAVLDDELRLSFQELVNGFYHDYIAFLVDRKRPDDALAVAERARARILEEGLELPGPALNANPRESARSFGGTILSYWLGPKRSYLWIITAADVRLEILPPAATIESLVAEFGNDLLNMRDPLRSRSGAELYRLLVAPAGIPRESRVAVVPDGHLSALNFETLIAGDHYWIDDVTVITSNSVALLGARRQRDAGGSLLLVSGGPPPDTAFPPLPNAAEEAKRVAREFLQPVVLRGKGATPAAYWRSKPESFDFIHFVAHGVAVRTRPLESSIVLSRDAGGYRLYARDVVKRRLGARLVTISSCYGAGVRAYSGEGLVGLAWAFLRAGAHQVVAALWEVNDSATPELMESMYAGIRAGRDPASALRDAKRRLLHRSDTVHRKPRYWAPFVLYSGA